MVDINQFDVKSFADNMVNNDVGCGYDYDEKLVFFTRNGKLIYLYTLVLLQTKDGLMLLLR